jgi:hypothetical protein
MTINELKDEFGESTGKLVILVIATLGIYYFIWFAQRRKKFNELAGEKVFSFNLLLAAAVCTALSDILTQVQSAMTGDTGYSDIFSFTYGILVCVISWKIASFLEVYLSQNHKIDIKLNRFLVVILNLFYINYYFNNLDEITSLAEGREYQSQIENISESEYRLDKNPKLWQGSS